MGHRLSMPGAPDRALSGAHKHFYAVWKPAGALASLVNSEQREHGCLQALLGLLPGLAGLCPSAVSSGRGAGEWSEANWPGWNSAAALRWSGLQTAANLRTSTTPTSNSGAGRPGSKCPNLWQPVPPPAAAAFKPTPGPSSRSCRRLSRLLSQCLLPSRPSWWLMRTLAALLQPT